MAVTTYPLSSSLYFADEESGETRMDYIILVLYMGLVMGLGEVNYTHVLDTFKLFMTVPPVLVMKFLTTQ